MITLLEINHALSRLITELQSTVPKADTDAHSNISAVPKLLKEQEQEDSNVLIWWVNPRRLQQQDEDEGIS